MYKANLDNLDIRIVNDYASGLSSPSSKALGKSCKNPEGLNKIIADNTYKIREHRNKERNNAQ